MADGNYITIPLDSARAKVLFNIPTSYARIMYVDGVLDIFWTTGGPVGERAIQEKVFCMNDGAPIGDVYLTNAAQAGLSVILFTSNLLRIGY